MALRWKTPARKIAVCLAFLCCGMVGASVSGAERATAILQSVTGTPTIFELSNGELRHASAVAVGSRYELPMEIETRSADSATFLLPNSVIEVSPNSLMRIVAPEGGDAGVVQRVLQQTGSSLFRVHRGTIDRFQVETPFLVSVVKGTVFNVVVRDDGATVSLQEGRLQVNSLDAHQTVELAPGDVAFAGRDGALRMLKLELTASGAKARESRAPSSPTKPAESDVRRTDQAAANGDGSGIVRGQDAVGVVSVAVADVVDPVAVDTVVEPAVDTVVTPVIDTVVEPVAPVIDVVESPAIDTVTAPALAPVVDSIDVSDAPLVGDVVNVVAGLADSTADVALNASPSAAALLTRQK